VRNRPSVYEVDECRHPDARRSAQNASRCAGALSDTLQVGMQTPSLCEIEDEEGPLNGRQRPKANA
jgi:hypothetical protein